MPNVMNVFWGFAYFFIALVLDVVLYYLWDGIISNFTGWLMIILTAGVVLIGITLTIIVPLGTIMSDEDRGLHI